MLLPRSKISCSGMLSLDSASCSMGDARGVVRQDKRWCRTRRRGLQLSLGDRNDLGERQILIHVRLKEIFDDRGAVYGL